MVFLDFCFRFLRFSVYFVTSSEVRNFVDFFSKGGNVAWEFRKDIKEHGCSESAQWKILIFSPVSMLMKVYTLGYFKFIYPISRENGIRFLGGSHMVIPKIFRSPIYFGRLRFFWGICALPSSKSDGDLTIYFLAIFSIFCVQILGK